MSEKNNSLSIFLIILLSIAGLAIVGFFIFAISGSNGGASWSFGISNTAPDTLVDEQSFKLSDFNTIRAKVDAGEIEIFSSANETEQDKISVRVYAKDKSYAEIRTEGSTLNIEDHTPECHIFCFNNNAVKYTLSIPSTYAGYFDLNSDYGDIRLGDFKDATVEAVSNYGNIKIDSIKVANLQLDAGNAEINACYGKLNIENDMGNVKIRHLELTENSSIKLDMGNATVDDAGDIRIDARVDMGNTNIEKNNYNSPITLTIENDMGNVTVK